MADRSTVSNERKAALLAAARSKKDARAASPPSQEKARVERPDGAADAATAFPSSERGPPRRPGSKFGAAADGWDAYNSWLDRVRQPSPPSRQAVIAKSLYSVSSYKNWADKARGAFDKPGK